MIGTLIKTIREGMGLSQEALAGHLHINQGALSKIESSQRKPSIDTLLCLYGMTGNMSLLAYIPQAEIMERYVAVAIKTA